MKVLFLNGPNLNLLGQRESDKYGSKTLADIEGMVGARAQQLGVQIEFRQSNGEGGWWIGSSRPRALGTPS